MDPQQAVDDLKTIRQIMERARRESGREGGWIMVLWGAIWLVGFVGSQFLPDPFAGGIWLALNPLGIGITVWLSVRISRRAVQSNVWRTVLLWWFALPIFDGLVLWLFHLDLSRDLIALILLSISLGYFQYGLLTDWRISIIGILIAVLTVGAFLLLPGYFYLVTGILGGGLLLVSGLWFLHRGE
jgi:hypothetical protein